ncbi:MAG: hypothetical protein JWL83_67 [Actinomycetia bacterium]|nr:hypothetical protein [Actinomycetes bacterium]
MPRNTQSTSAESYRQIKPQLGPLQERVLEVLREIGPATDQEIQRVTGLHSQTEMPRRNELVQLDLVRNTGRKKLNPETQRKAIVWEITEKAA